MRLLSTRSMGRGKEGTQSGRKTEATKGAGAEEGQGKGAWDRVVAVAKNITVEPLMLLDGLAFSNMYVYMENLQMDRVCRVTCGFTEQVCGDLKAQHDASVEVQKNFSVFALYNGIIAAALPLFFILFMGAWSDKYGRKVPLVAVQVGHVLHAAGYLLVSLVPTWPVEVLLPVTLLDTLGGGVVSFLTVANSYIGDVTPEESRTSRVGLANSIWFLGGPFGTLMGRYIYGAGGYLALFTTSLVFYVISVIYVTFLLPESHGPFVKKLATKTEAQKESLELRESVAAVYGLDIKKKAASHALTDAHPTVATMVKDFFDPRRIVDSFRSTLRRREGNTRALILILIVTSLLRRLTRSPYVFAFTRHELGWEAADYSIWVTYKNLMATTGSLVAVPLLSGRLGMPDILLAVIGAASGILEYAIYGFVSQVRPFLLWIGPLAALLINSCTIAQRSMMTKFVAKDEIGKVSAVLGALDGMTPMVQSVLYTAVYHASVSLLPSAHFFLGVGASLLMLVLFCVIKCADKSGQYDVEGAKVTQPKGPVSQKSIVIRTNSWWMNSDALALKFSTNHATIIHPHQELTHPSMSTRQKTLTQTISPSQNLPCQDATHPPLRHQDLTQASLPHELTQDEPQVHPQHHQQTEPAHEPNQDLNSPVPLYAPKQLSWSRKLMLGLKSVVKTIAKPRTEQGVEVMDRKVALSSLFVNINSVAGDVMFPKETEVKEAVKEAVKEVVVEEVVVEDPRGNTEGCDRDLPV